MSTALTTQAYRRPSKAHTGAGVCLPWPDDDVAAVAFRLRALGASECAATDLLVGLADAGVRNLRAYLRTVADDDLCRRVAEQAAGGHFQRRMDIIPIRTPARWPWRTSTSQPGGGERQ